MLPKKTKKADLENKRVIFLQIGFLISLALALLAFEWATGEPKKSVILGPVKENPDEDFPDITFMDKKKPVEVKPYLYTFDIKDNDSKLIDEAVNIDVEINPWEGFDIPDEPEKVDEDIFVVAEEMPTFMNGDISEFIKYIQSTVVYDKDAIDMDIQGKVFASFVVNKEGYIENIRIVKGVDPLLDSAVIEALEASPRWKPGRQRDIPVKLIFTIPVVFKINY